MTDASTQSPTFQKMAVWAVGAAAVASIATAFDVRRLAEKHEERLGTAVYWFKNLAAAGIALALLLYLLAGLYMAFMISCSYVNCS